MKVLVETVDQEGFDALIGKNVTVFCGVYIYAGKLVGVNETCIKLDDAKIVYETGALNASEWKDAQALPGSWYVQRAAIESFGILK